MSKTHLLLVFLSAWLPAQAQVTFTDISAGAGIGVTGGNYGVAAGDYDNDGWEDLFVATRFGAKKLYRNLGNGTYENVASQAGITFEGDTKTAVWGDVNNDGWLDLFLANKEVGDILYLNNGTTPLGGGVTFTDISASAGLNTPGKSKCAIFGDYDNDGLLDLYVAREFIGNTLYKNMDGTHFSDVTFATGATDNQLAMGCIFFDFDNDNDLDLYLTHDAFMPNILYRNNGDGTFTDISVSTGANYSGYGMGVDFGDFNNDGWLDIYITNLGHNTLYRNNGAPPGGEVTFTNIAIEANAADTGMGWGTAFFDCDNDGWQDIYVANNPPSPSVCYQNLHNETFSLISQGNVLGGIANSYGMACTDLDNDGKLDIFIANLLDTVGNKLLKNNDLNGNHWLAVKLRGTQSNSAGIGARVTLETGGTVQTDEVAGGSGYSSQNSLKLHFGTGAATVVDKLTVRWPSGIVDVFENVPGDQLLQIEEGETLLPPQVGLIAHFPFDETSGTTALDAVSGQGFSIHNEYPTPEPDRAPGITGNALRTNGYATWVEGTLPAALPTQELSVSLWFALETYPTGDGSLFSVSTGNNGVKAFIDKFGSLKMELFINGTVNAFNWLTPLTTFDWHHLVFTVNTASQQLNIYLDGQLIGTKTLNSGTIGYPANQAVLMGKNPVGDFDGIFNKNLVNGLLDEVKIFDKTLTDSEVADLFAEGNTAGAPDLKVPDSRFAGNLRRPKYHSIPQAGWTNEPHGFIFDNGEYHLFFQKNGNGPYHEHINWGHLRSEDLVTWEELPPVLHPEENNEDKDGCWSGTSAVADDGTPAIIYTGVDGSAQMMLAFGNDDWTQFEKEDAPLVYTPPAPYTCCDFRDPYLWKENAVWNLIIGTGLNGNGTSGGAVLHYTSPDLLDWTYNKVLYKGFPATDGSGQFWEMPVMWKFGDKHLLLVNPTPWDGQPAKALYWTGIFDGENFIPDALQPKQMDSSNGMLAPAFAADAQSRSVAIGIIPDLLPDFEQRSNGYAHCYSLPRVLSLDSDGTLLQSPHPDLVKLRGEHHHFENIVASTATTGAFGDLHGRQLEILAVIDKGTATRMGIEVGKSPDGVEKTRVYYDFGFGISQIDRTFSSSSTTVPKSFLGINQALPDDEDLTLHLFLDGSVVEVFINEQYAYSGHIFPVGTESDGVDVYVKSGQATFKTVDIWEMKDMNDSLFLAAQEVFSAKNSIQNIYPNPTSGDVFVEMNLPQSGEVALVLYDMLGRVVFEKKMGRMAAGSQTLRLAGGEWQEGVKGMFFMKITVDGREAGKGKVVLEYTSRQ